MGALREVLCLEHCRMQLPRLESRDRRRLMVATDQQQMGPQSSQKELANKLATDFSITYMQFTLFTSFTTQ